MGKKKVSEAISEVKEENGAEVKKETTEAVAAGKSFFKEAGEAIAAWFKAIGNFFKKLFKKDNK